MTFHHYSVLLRETIEGLAIRADGVYVDGTLGGGGHALSICERLSGRGRLIGIDQDGAAIEAASERLKDYRDRAVIVRGNYEDIAEILMRLQIERVDGICLDLGVSSYQLDEGGRGFSYRTDAALDMRMDQRGERTAADIVNSYSEEALFRIIRDYGEDRFARNITKHIVQYREKKRIETTLELSGIISGAIPARVRALSGHPAKRSFQAIRIELNRELEVLENTLDRMIDLLSEGGRLCVISFHSLEDRIVKSKFRTAENPCICPPDFPVCSCGRKSRGIVLTKKPILPSEEELLENRRSQSAKLRIFEKRTEEGN